MDYLKKIAELKAEVQANKDFLASDDGLSASDIQDFEADTKSLLAEIATLEKKVQEEAKSDKPKPKKAAKAKKSETPPLMDANGKYRIDDEAIAALDAHLKTLPSTKSMHLDSKGIYTAKRKALHTAIVKEEIENSACIKQDNPIAILTGGLPGAGKSTYIRTKADWMFSEKIFKIDADEIRAKLPEYKGWNADQTHEETSALTKQVLAKVGKFDCSYDVIYDGTMNKPDKYIPLIKTLKGEGYRVFVLYLQVPKDVSIKRAMNRFRDTGRYVPLFVIEDADSKGLSAFNTIKTMVDGWVLVNGETQEVIDSGGDDIPEDRDYDSLVKPTSKKKKATKDNRPTPKKDWPKFEFTDDIGLYTPHDVTSMNAEWDDQISTIRDEYPESSEKWEELQDKRFESDDVFDEKIIAHIKVRDDLSSKQKDYLLRTNVSTLLRKIPDKTNSKYFDMSLDEIIEQKLKDFKVGKEKIVLNANKKSTFLKAEERKELPLKELRLQVRELRITQDNIKDVEFTDYRESSPKKLKVGDRILVSKMQGAPFIILGEGLAKIAVRNIVQDNTKARVTKKQGTTVEVSAGEYKAEVVAMKKDQGENGLNGGQVTDMTMTDKETGEVVAVVEDGEITQGKENLKGTAQVAFEKAVEKASESRGNEPKKSSPKANPTPSAKPKPKENSEEKPKSDSRMDKLKPATGGYSSCSLEDLEKKGLPGLLTYVSEEADQYAAIAKQGKKVEKTVPALANMYAHYDEDGKLIELVSKVVKRGMLISTTQYAAICPTRGIAKSTSSRPPKGFNPRKKNWKKVISEQEMRSIYRGEAGINDKFCVDLGKKVFQGKGSAKEFYQVCWNPTTKKLVNQQSKARAEAAKTLAEKEGIKYIAALRKVVAKARKQRK